jgi:hypothetical protein
LARRTRRVNQGHNRLNWDGLPFVYLYLPKHTRGRGRDFGVYLVSRDFEERLIALDFVAGLFQPFGDGAFKDAFAHLGHNDVNRHD